MRFHPHPLFIVLLGLAAGSLAPPALGTTGLKVALALSAALALLASVRPRGIPVAALVTAAAGAGAILSASARMAHEARALPDAVAEFESPIQVEGRVIAEPRLVDGDLRFDLATSRLTFGLREVAWTGRLRVVVRASPEQGFTRARDLAAGDLVTAFMDVRRPESSRSPGGFDQLAWARREGIHGFATCKNERLLRIAPSGASPSWITRARGRLAHSWRHVEDRGNRAVTTSMVLGDEGALDPETREDFRAAGLLHLLVVSGSQVAALILGLRRLMPRRALLSWTGCAFECGVLLFYCELSGAGDSIVRATAMAVAFSLAVRLDLARGTANFLAGAGIVLLVFRPLDVPDPGAQMSFAATLALVVLAPPLASWMITRGVPGLLAEALAATLVASTAVAPIVLAHFHRLSLVSIPANLVAGPFAALLLYASIATAALDAIWAPGAVVSGGLCNAIAGFLRWIAQQAASLDPDWRGPALPLVLLPAFLAPLLLAGWRRIGVPIAGLAAALTLSGLPRGDGRLHVWFLDAGQGDAILVESPGGRAAIIDAGPAFDTFDAGERIVAEALWSLGHQRLAFLAVTQRHADHEGGAPFLVRHLAPEAIYTNGPSKDLPARATPMRRGSSWTLDGVTFRVLSPDPEWPTPARDENARSLVLEVVHGRSRLLLMGDAGAAIERRLSPGLSPYDLVKAGHHGSPSASTAEFVQSTRPRIAVISVGARNRFGHPARRVVETWERAGALVWRTDRRRTLHMMSDGASVSFEPPVG